MSTGWPYKKFQPFVPEGCVFPPTDAVFIGLDLASGPDISIEVPLQPWQKEVFERLTTPRNRRAGLRMSDLSRSVDVTMRRVGKTQLSSAVAVEDIT